MTDEMLKGGDNFKDLCTDERILKCILQKWDVSMWTGLTDSG